MLTPLTPRQKEVLDFVNNTYDIHGKFPTVREIAEELGLKSPGNIHRILNILEDKGYINNRRSYTLIELPDHTPFGENPPISSLESKIYESVVKTIGRSGTAPNIRGICDQLGGVSIGGVHKGLKSLERKGYLTLSQSQAYGISLTMPNEPKLYPVVIQLVPCEYENFLSPLINENAWVEPLPLEGLIPDFVEADATSIFGTMLLDNRQLVGYSFGDYLLFKRSSRPKLNDVVAVKNRGRVIVRHLVSSSTSEVRLSVVENKDKYKKNYRLNAAEDIEAKHDEVLFLGYAIAAIVRNIGTRRAF
jgi:SOS-response transcriptional repressor LexA